MRVLIIGAGLCGLWAANQLRDAGGFEIQILEKSRGVGGRMATRRSEAAKFDHGAQFYTVKADSEKANQRWLKAELVQPWFTSDGVTRMKCTQGMTALAKNLAKDLDIRLEQRADRLEYRTDHWIVTTTSNEIFTTDVILLTAPLPQALELLAPNLVAPNSVVPDAKLSKVTYAKALVGLFEGVESSGQLTSPDGYRENVGGDIYSIADQMQKGVSPVPAWTVTMTPDFSDHYYDEKDEVVLAAITKSVAHLDPKFHAASAQLKKWRYSHPLSQAENAFVEITRGLYMAGDGFTRPSLNGALSSAQTWVDHMLRPS